MARRIADLLIKIGADSYEFQQKAEQVQRGLGSMEKKLASVGKQLSLKLTAPLAALGATSVVAFDGADRAAAKVRQAIKSTSGAARLSYEELAEYASELQGKTLFDDDTILNDAAAQLLTFTNIAGDNFRRTMAVAMDLSTVLDGDLKSASLQLGKALNDPVKNLSALSRSGIQFSAEQKKVINELATTNRLAEAQGVILQELERQYGGQAEAAAKVGMGALRQLKNSRGDFMEQIGQTIMPAITSLSQSLQRVVARLQQLSPEGRKIIVIAGGIAAAIGPLSIGVGSIIKMLPALGAGFAALVSPVGLAVAAVVALGAAFIYAAKRKKELFEQRVDTLSNLTLGTLEDNLRENRRQQEVNEREGSLQGGSIADKVTYAVNKPKRRKELQAEEKALEEAIARRRKEMEQAAKTEQEEAEVMAKLQAATEVVTTVTRQTAGPIAKLQKQVEEWENRKLLPDATVEDIAKANEEIAKLQERIKYLQNVKPEDLNIVKAEPLAKQLQFIESATASAQATAQTTTIPLPKIDAEIAVSDYQKQMQTLRERVSAELYGWADETNEQIVKDVYETQQIVANYTEALVAKGWKFEAAMAEVQQRVSSAVKSFDESISKFLSDSIITLADSLGQLLAGDLGFGGLLRNILSQFASFLKQIGSQLIEFGVMIEAFKSSLKSVLSNPWVAIGIGAAMVTAAAVMTSLIEKNANNNVPALAAGGLAYGKTYALIGDNPNASVDPEVIAPLSKLQAMLPTAATAQNIQIALSGELTAKGRDLVYVLGKENFKIGVMSG